MRIVVVQIATESRSGGGISILKDLYNYVVGDSQNEWIFLLSEPFIKNTHNVRVLLLPEVKKNWLNRLAFDFIWGRKVLDKLHPDIVLQQQHTRILGTKAPQVLYLDQVLPFQREKKYSFLKKDEFTMAVRCYLIGALIKYSCKKSASIIFAPLKSAPSNLAFFKLAPSRFAP